MRLLILFFCSSFADLFGTNQIIYDGLKNSILSFLPEEADLAVYINGLDDEKVVDYVESYLVPILSDFAKGESYSDKWTPEAIAEALINVNSIEAFNVTIEESKLLSLRNPVATFIDDLENIGEDYNPEDSLYLALVFVDVVGVIDKIFESFIIELDITDLDEAERLTSLVYSHVGLVMNLAHVFSTSSQPQIDVLAQMMVEIQEYHFPDFEGEDWLEYFTGDFLPFIINLNFTTGSSFDDLSQIVSHSLFEALQVQITSSQAKIIQDKFKQIPELIGQEFWSKMFCLNGDSQNICSTRSIMEFLFIEVHEQMQTVNDIVFDLAAAFPVDLDGNAWTGDTFPLSYLRMFRHLVWRLVLVQKSSQYRTRDIEKLQTQEAIFMTNFYFGFDLFGFYADKGQYNSTFELEIIEALNPDDEIEDQAQAYFDAIDAFYNTTLGNEYFDLVVIPTFDLIQSFHRLQIPIQDAFYLLSDIVLISTSFENVLTGKSQLSASEDNNYQNWSYINQILRLSVTVYGNYMGFVLPEYDFEALVAMLMNENLKGNYDDAASSLNSLYRMLYTEKNYIIEINNGNTLLGVEGLIGQVNKMVDKIGSFAIDFNEEYEINYNERIIFLDTISNVTEVSGTSSAIGLVITNSVGLVENALGIYINLIKVLQA